MLQVYRGRVKFFKRDKGYGFITPTQKGGPDVFFHARYFSGVVKDFQFELELDFEGQALNTWMPEYRVPKPGDIVVYCEAQDQKGLMAINWTFAKDWDRAQFMTNLFKRWGNGFIRVMRSGTRENRYRPTFIWKGTYNEFVRLLDRKELNYDESVYTEELLISSKWERSWRDPRNWHDNYRGTTHGL